jgi:hypothetical protein
MDRHGAAVDIIATLGGLLAHSACLPRDGRFRAAKSILAGDRMVTLKVTLVNKSIKKMQYNIFIEKNKPGKCGTPGRRMCSILAAIWC